MHLRRVRSAARSWLDLHTADNAAAGTVDARILKQPTCCSDETVEVCARLSVSSARAVHVCDRIILNWSARSLCIPSHPDRAE